MLTRDTQQPTRWILSFLLVLALLFSPQCMMKSSGSEQQRSETPIWEERLALYQQVAQLFNLPWTYLAAIDQFERSLLKGEELKKKQGLIAITIPPHKWAGLLNPNPEDTNPETIAFFAGMGQDGSGDGNANPDNDLDILYSIAASIAQEGWTENDFRIALWKYYRNEKSLEIIAQFAAIYDKYQRLDLFTNQFPIPPHFNYSYKSTWGAPRGWGGQRIHEGTDIFASYGTPVRATSYGYIETKGWNRYGGWRIGIRDLNNYYHYFAHLSGFNQELKLGDIVQPGEILGYVGSSGYGAPGTQGKFPPHLHYGIYKYNGKNEWAFDPFPHLRKWEREMRAPKKR